MTTASPFTSFKCANLRVKPRHLGHGSSWWRHSGRALRPWKIIFAFIPPTDYCGGQGCEFSGFWSSPGFDLGRNWKSIHFFPIHLMFQLQLPQQRSFHDRVGLLLLLIDFHWLSSQKPQGLEEILEFLGKIRWTTPQIIHLWKVYYYIMVYSWWKGVFSMCGIDGNSTFPHTQRWMKE